MPQELSAKEQSLFRTVVRNYEDKQYKKGLKVADQILRKNPKHGDTLAMKALIMNSQGKTVEAFALAKFALQCDMKSHVCWHVYGLLYRTAKNFEEAIKAYKFALRLEPESQQIQRDLALLQVQMRDYQGYIVSRTAMVKSRPGFRVNWTALAVAHHLNGDPTEAERVLTSYEDTLKNPTTCTDIEHSEAILYKNTLIAEQGDFQRALEHLNSAGKSCLDRVAVLELRANYHARLGQKQDAVKAYGILLDRNSEYKTYYDSLIEVMEIEPSNHKALKALFDEYAEKYPRCDAARRLPLDFLEGMQADVLSKSTKFLLTSLTGDDFRQAADSYLNRMLNKGVPSTFANLKQLYSNSEKKDILADLAQKYLMKYEGQGNSQSNTNENKLKCISAAYFFLAQHYNYHLSRDLEKAMEYIKKAIELDPLSVDFHMTKARIWKHLGDIAKASEVMEHARTLDERDRHINTKAAKYQLRNDETEKAIKTMGLFTRADTIGGPLADLHDMQCMWYLIEDGESYVRQGKIGLALKRFTSVFNIFDVWHEDQFDFHSFSLRKGQIRSYIDMIRWEDKLREHPFYTRAALSAVKIYIELYDRPLASRVNGNIENSCDPIEKKKAAKKALKEHLRAEREAAAKKAAPNRSTGVGSEEVKKMDDDPDGIKLAATTEPLNDAMKFLSPLLQLRRKSIDVQTAAFEIYIRKKKYILALKCLLKGISLDDNHPKVYEQIVRFKLAFQTDLSSISPRVVEVVKSEFICLSDSINLTEYNEQYILKNKDQLRKIISAMKNRK